MSKLTDILVKPLRHPATVQFFAAGGALALLGNYVTFRNHQQDMATATLNSAVAAISHISDLTSERRERAALVVSSVRRGAPKKEIEARKKAYDEAYVQWNSKVPGELLQIRASLNLEYGSYFQDYVDGLTNTERLKHHVPDQRDSAVVSFNPGILNLMDACLTQAYDTYRLTNYEDDKFAVTIINQCHFTPLYNDLVMCISDVSRVIYDAVMGKLDEAVKNREDTVVAASCMPPDASVKWSKLPPMKPDPAALPAAQVTSERSKG